MYIEKIQLEPDEEILIQVRKHWFVFTMQLFGVALLGLIPFIFYVIIARIAPPVVTESTILNSQMIIALYCAYILIIWMALFNIWTNYYLDVWTITNKRLIAADQKGFFSRTTASFRLDRLQDTTVIIRGIIATFLDYGTLETQTAGEERNFRATGLPHPNDLKSLILRAADDMDRGDDERKESGV